MKTNFNRVLDKTKFLFEWKGEMRSVSVVHIEPAKLLFEDLLPLPLGDSPEVTISVKVRHIWYEHHIVSTEWLLKDGFACGLTLLGPDEALKELKKNLEIGLCV